MVFKSRDRQQLLNDAIAILSEQGLYGTSFNDFAKAAGTNTNTLRRHFGSLENLKKSAYDTVVDEAVKTGEVLDQVSRKSAVQDKAAQLLRTWYAKLKSPSARLLFQAHVSGIRKYSDSYRSLEQIIALLSSLFPRAMKANGTAQASTGSIVSALLHLKLFTGPEVSSEEESELVDSVIEAWLAQLPEITK